MEITKTVDRRMKGVLKMGKKHFFRKRKESTPETLCSFQNVRIRTVKKVKWQFEKSCLLLSIPYAKISINIDTAHWLVKTQLLAGDLQFDYRADRIGHNVASGSPPLLRFFGAVLPKRKVTEMGATTRYMLRCNTMSTTKI